MLRLLLLLLLLVLLVLVLLVAAAAAAAVAAVVVVVAAAAVLRRRRRRFALIARRHAPSWQSWRSTLLGVVVSRLDNAISLLLAPTARSSSMSLH
jgi:hypothetical protein